MIQLASTIPLSADTIIGLAQTSRDPRQGLLMAPLDAESADEYFTDEFVGDEDTVQAAWRRHGLDMPSDPLALAPAHSAQDAGIAEQYGTLFAQATYALEFGRLDLARNLHTGAKLLVDQHPELALAATAPLEGLAVAIECGDRTFPVTLPTAINGISIQKLKSTLSRIINRLHAIHEGSLYDSPDRTLFIDLESTDNARRSRAIVRIFELIQPLVKMGITPYLHAGKARGLTETDGSDDIIRLRLESIAGSLVGALREMVQAPERDMGHFFHPFIGGVKNGGFIWGIYPPELGGLGYDGRKKMPLSLEVLAKYARAKEGDHEAMREFYEVCKPVLIQAFNDGARKVRSKGEKIYGSHQQDYLYPDIVIARAMIEFVGDLFHPKESEITVSHPWNENLVALNDIYSHRFTAFEILIATALKTGHENLDRVTQAWVALREIADQGHFEANLLVERLVEYYNNWLLRGRRPLDDDIPLYIVLPTICKINLAYLSPENRGGLQQVMEGIKRTYADKPHYMTWIDSVFDRIAIGCPISR